MNIPENLRYTKSHEWVRKEDDGTYTFGITEHAQDALGDIVYVELPEVGSRVAAAEECGVVESTKAASDIYSPLDGEVVAVNEALIDSPEMINESPYEQGWFIRITDVDEAQFAALLSGADYEASLHK